MTEQEKQVKEIETIIKSNLAEGSFANAFARKVAIQIVEHYQPKLPEGSVVLSREGYDELLSRETRAFIKGEKQGSKETAEKLLNEWAETDAETGGFNLPYIHEFAKQFDVEIQEPNIER